MFSDHLFTFCLIAANGTFLLHPGVAGVVWMR